MYCEVVRCSKFDATRGFFTLQDATCRDVMMPRSRVGIGEPVSGTGSRATKHYMPEPVRGVAYPLWVEIEQRRLDAGMEKSELAKRAKLARSTIDNLKSVRRAPAVKTVHALADVFNMDRQRAEKLAGLVEAPPPQPDDGDVRAAVLASSAYTREQKGMLLAMIDTIERANGNAPTDVENRR